ncbi:hypothetical protein F0562_001730 [Nyssa sinensis]|uniref:PB1-like domain-containing protein n=1 Tax=Nyssa sinensis TaxID=561372 RepID=A0A5J5C502_9ASTE|nr:hypothetical protein F0562_001730 [Nyssa sinensis]
MSVNSNSFTIKIHHEGQFVDNPEDDYVHGTVNIFNNCDLDLISTYLNGGLRPLSTDSKVLEMCAIASQIGYISVYIEHEEDVNDNEIPKEFDIEVGEAYNAEGEEDSSDDIVNYDPLVE